MKLYYAMKNSVDLRSNGWEHSFVIFNNRCSTLAYHTQFKLTRSSRLREPPTTRQTPPGIIPYDLVHSTYVSKIQIKVFRLTKVCISYVAKD